MSYSIFEHDVIISIDFCEFRIKKPLDFFYRLSRLVYA
jgi:hypothetical protein